MENPNLVKFETNKITIKYHTEILTFETQKNPLFEVGSHYIDFKGDRFFLTKRKSLQSKL